MQILFMIYFHTKFHMSISNNSLVIIIKSEVKENFRMTTISLFYILQKVN
jgi:hypothetical protein